MSEIIDLITANPMTTMEVHPEERKVSDKDDRMVEEKLLTNTLKSHKIHAKAKVLIYDALDNIERTRASKGKVKEGRDMHESEVDFNSLKEKLYQLLIHEDPLEAKRLGILGANADTGDGFGVGMIDDDEDAGLETQVISIVEKFFEEASKRTSKRLEEMKLTIEDDFNDKIKSQSEI